MKFGVIFNIVVFKCNIIDVRIIVVWCRLYDLEIIGSVDVIF